MDNPVSDTIIRNLHHTATRLGQWVDKNFVDIIIIVVLAWLMRHFGAKLVSQILRRTIRADLYPTKTDREKRVNTLESLAHAVIRTGVYVFAGILIIGTINPGYTTALFASAGLVTVALGFGAKDLINDFVRGIFIITENQYRVGDTVDIAGVTGVVEAVTIRTTVLRDIDGNVHHVPNGAIIVTTNKTIGYSKLNEQLIFPADTDLELIEHTINHVGEELAAEPEFASKIKKPPHFSMYNGYGGGGLIVKVSGTTSPSSKFVIRTEFYRRLTKALRKHKIELVASTPVPAPPTPAKK